MIKVPPEDLLKKITQKPVVTFLQTYFVCERLARDLHKEYIFESNRKEIAKHFAAFKGAVLDDKIINKIASKVNMEKIRNYEAHKTSVDVILLRKCLESNPHITSKDIDKIFLSTMSAVNRRSSRYLRNKITHTIDKSCVEEVIRRYDELMQTMNKFINLFN